MTVERTGRQRFAGTLGAAALVAVATAYWASRAPMPQGPALQRGEGAPPRAAAPAAASSARGAPDLRAAQAHPAIGTGDTETAAVAEHLAVKYQFLLDDLRYLDADRVRELTAALLAREQLAGMAGQEAALARRDSHIHELLSPADRATFEALKDSDEELYRLNEYAGGAGNVAPLEAHERESILRTKLAYRETFRRRLLDSGLHRAGLGAEERRHALAVASHALQEYRQGYLQEVRQYLPGDEQFTLLSNYEASEFGKELARLRDMADGPAGGDVGQDE